MEKNRNVEKEIVDAARRVFHVKGYKESTMRDIASEANINMAMLHYYFRSKDNLFFIVFDEAFRLLYGKIATYVADSSMEIFDKIRAITKEYISFFNSQPYLPPFVVGEIIRSPDKIGKRLQDIISPTDMFRIFSDQLQKEYEKGRIKKISALTLILNIVSLCVFPAISKAVLQEVLSFDDVSMNMVLKLREHEVADFIINAIKT